MRFSKSPFGLLGALDLKALGQNPETFGDTIAPVLELAPFYFPPVVRQFVQNIAGPITAGTSVALTVPANEAWLVYLAGGTIPLLTADAITDAGGLYIAYQANPSAAAIQLGTGPIYPTGVAVNAWAAQVAVSFPRPWIMPPGSSLLLRNSARINVAAPAPVQCNALVYPFTP